ncbi:MULTISPECIES: septal ring lytic transglycosylase RlpA family protein [Kordiimonas]|jgi:rare lipoprotein A|uniref:septal ring lytic transglycosylase RlpA family protein n=1 Tax=Kordiimonas TaxID=288021 RepID=UPI0025806ADF|nr:septal ring lytic transglycosylase RlpA family protein [Kordiimonas sp. UBA4487]
MRNLVLLMILSAFLAACSSSMRPIGRMPQNDELPRGSQGVERKVGKPYKIAGVWYTPAEQPNYDEVGYASWYGRDFHGKKTANGEIYNMNALTAAHKTLPLPTYVKVTNLENGRTILLRVNDRGPFVKGRIIDISRRGAQLLGFDKQGVTKVRVQAVDEHGRVPKLPRTQTARSAPPGDAHYIQVGAYSQRENAEIQAGRLKGRGHDARIEQSASNGRMLWRVRVGPFIEMLLAEEKLDRIVADGFYEARIFTESTR